MNRNNIVIRFADLQIPGISNVNPQDVIITTNHHLDTTDFERNKDIHLLLRLSNIGSQRITIVIDMLITLMNVLMRRDMTRLHHVIMETEDLYRLSHVY